MASKKFQYTRGGVISITSLLDKYKMKYYDICVNGALISTFVFADCISRSESFSATSNKQQARAPPEDHQEPDGEPGGDPAGLQEELAGKPGGQPLLRTERRGGCGLRSRLQ